MLAAHPLISRPSLNNWAGVSGNGNGFNTRKVKRQTDIDHHGPKYILIICHLPDPPIFSLPTTFKQLTGSLFHLPDEFLLLILSRIADPHHFYADRIRIQLLFKLIGICDHWSMNAPTASRLHLEP
jgi:hypothetical protein